VNVGSDVMKAQAESVFMSQQEDRNIEYVDLMRDTLKPAKEMVKYYIELSGSVNKAE